ncbi:hypothetical protein RUM44_001228 [Polyplax serrata]|uniref:UDP-glucuronosyltransferase n=1 Tax=Polyplax serrata TaxID=468196 RepID=A0ABR1AJH3_POLSC
MKLLFLLSALELFQLCWASKILFLIPMPSKSHFNLGDRVTRELVQRGHEVTLMSTQKMENPPKNLTEIVVSLNEEQFEKMFATAGREGKFQMRNMNPITFLLFSTLGEMMVDTFMSDKSVQQLLKSNQKFDLVIGECFLTEGLLGGFAHKYNAPIAAIGTFLPNTWTNEMIGNPAPASYIPEPITPFTNHMTFWERCINFVYGMVAQIIHYNRHLPTQDRLMKKYFGETLPPLKDMLTKTSLMLVNNHYSLAFPRPYLPNMVEIGGFHIKPPKPLPKDLQAFMDGAKDGVILFSMGSVLPSSDFPEEKVQGILRALSQVKQKVLWKFEKENIPNLPKNVKISKWLPQSDILAHPNTKLFITHGGLLSYTEAVYRGVPLVAIPIFGDQPMNVRFMEELEVGVKLEYDNINEHSLISSINKVLGNPKYAKNMKYRSTLLRDVPISQLDNAIYWIEYVIRHKGAPHLQSKVQELTWYQVYLLDVIGFIGLVVFGFMFALWKLFKCCKATCCGKKASKMSQKKRN